MKQTLLTLALSAALLPATFAQVSQTTTHSSQSSSSTTVNDPVMAPEVNSHQRESSSVTETRAKYGKHHTKVQSRRYSSNSVSHNEGDVPATGVTRRSYHSSSSSSTTTNVPPTTTTTTTTTVPQE